MSEFSQFCVCAMKTEPMYAKLSRFYKFGNKNGIFQISTAKTYNTQEQFGISPLTGPI